MEVLLKSDQPRWGLEIIKLTGRPSGSVYPLLDRLERAGWVTSSWDDDSERRGPRRRMYVLTPGGAQEAVKACAKAAGRAGNRTKARSVPVTRPEVAR
ncbi:PadR family transcriptional regulator [Saccharothrix sp. NRRL B-16348]|nr:PadR family transcriptional regulator [Saccharothrix sp. NRRL B-16348]